MKQIPINEENNSSYNKKAVRMIVILVVLGIVTGLILSYVFVDEANQKIENFGKWGKPVPRDSEYNPQPLSTSDVIFPTIGVITVSISTFFLLGLIIVYLKIFLNTSSKYIVGLLFFLIPLFIKSIFSVNTLRSLFVSPAIPYFDIKRNIGFEFGGLGGIIVMVSFFEIIGLSILLYLSSE
jgi:hypothetical protein